MYKRKVIYLISVDKISKVEIKMPCFKEIFEKIEIQLQS